MEWAEAYKKANNLKKLPTVEELPAALKTLCKHINATPEYETVPVPKAYVNCNCDSNGNESQNCPFVEMQSVEITEYVSSFMHIYSPEAIKKCRKKSFRSKFLLREKRRLEHSRFVKDPKTKEITADFRSDIRYDRSNLFA